MISTIVNEYSFGNILLLCFQIILPLLIYIISFTYVSDDQTTWYNNLKSINNFNIISGNKGIFIGCIVHILTGIASLLIIDSQYYKNITGNSRVGNKILTEYFKGEKESNIHLFLFPIMVFISNLGFIIAYQLKDFLTHVILNGIAIIICIYLMFHYARSISYNVSLLLLPMLLWQIFNIVYYGFEVTTKS